MVAVRAAALPGIAGVGAGLARRYPALARGSKLRALSAGRYISRGPCRRKEQKSDGEACSAQHGSLGRRGKCARLHWLPLSAAARRKLSWFARSCSGESGGEADDQIHLPRRRIEQSAAIHAKCGRGGAVTFAGRRLWRGPPRRGGGGRGGGRPPAATVGAPARGAPPAV